MRLPTIDRTFEWLLAVVGAASIGAASIGAASIGAASIAGATSIEAAIFHAVPSDAAVAVSARRLRTSQQTEPSISVREHASVHA